MADRGHELTDEILNKLENRIADEYAVATRDMKRKLREYMEKFKAEDEKQKALLKAGKITKKEYKDWRYRHMMVGKRWEAMKDVLAEDLKRASDIALKISGEKMADVYALNANFATYQIEHDAKIDTGFTLYSHDTAEYLLSDERQLMPGPSDKKARDIAANKAMQWDKQKIQSAVLQGVLQGEGPHKVAERLRQVGQMDYNASVRYARTMTTSAQNAGRYNSFRRARDLGVDLTIEWMATLDSRTRHEHRMMHGRRTTVDEPFYTPDGYTIYYPADCTGESTAPQSMIWNCFVGDTKVASDCEIVRSYKHKFKGSLIRVRTAAGVDFTCTPNHPILTPDGWIPAAFLHKGDHLLITRVGDDGSLTRNGNVYHVHSSIKALHDSLESLGNSERISMSNFDFHGDVPTSDVEVVSKERLLRNDGNTCGGQSSRKIRLKLPNAFRLCERHFMLGFRRIYISSLRFVRGCCKPLTLIWRRLRHADIHGFGTVSNGDTCVSEYAINDLPTVTNIRSELLDGLAGNVFVDDVVSVDRKPGRLLCHVYNLQTESGYYFVGNSIPQNGEKYNGNYYAIAKNCRCTLRAMVKGYERETIRSSPKMGDMSFEEWQQEKEPKEKPADKAPKFQSRFKPAENNKEAESFIRQIIDDKVFGALGVNYDGIDVGVANIINKTLIDLYDEFDIKKFGGIIAPAGNTKYGKMISSATAAFSPINRSFLINRKTMKNVKTAEKAIANEKTVIADVLANPQKYDLSRMGARARKIVEASKVSGRGTVPDTIQDVLHHEFGHSLEKQLRGMDSYKGILDNMPKYAPKISGYAAESASEYIAESFASWRKGEGLTDPLLEKAFMSLRRK